MLKTPVSRLLRPLQLAALVFSTSLSLDAATSVSQHGITWTFSADRPVGQFANGDWWVVGPVTISHISPNDPTPTDSTHIHGSMINPQYNTTGRPNWNGIQGWDSRIRDSTYNASLNIGRSLPYTIQTAASVVTCKSILEQAIGNNVQMDTIAILTVLPAAPAPGSFRPPYIGTNKTVRWNKNNLDYTKLKALPPVANTPSFAEVEAYFEKAHIAMGPSWSGTYLHPRSNDSPGYGREISHKVGAGGLLLNLNYPATQKERLLVRMVQRGIDIYGVQAAGGGWWPDGGHNHGRKFPMILAGVMLGDADILSRANGSFAEDGQHFYVSQADVDRVRKTGREPYTRSMIGTPEWGGNHIGQPEGDGSQWSVPYRTLVGVSNIGPVLAARIMGMQSQWNHPATFAYMDRFYSVEAGNVSTGTNSIQPFVSNMWKAYRQNSGGTTTTPPPVVASYKVGDRISVTANTNVRQSSGMSGVLLGTQLAGSTGTITSGPTTVDNITWWQVNYDAGVDGWSGSNNFAPSSTVTPKAPEAPVVTMEVGSRVALTSNTNVRQTGSLSGVLLGSQMAGATATIIGGPVSADNITWWQLNYDTGVDGWSGMNNLTPSTTPQPTETVAGGLKIGDRIQVTASTNVRQSGSLTGILLGAQPIAAAGRIVGGPVTSNSITWWQMDYDSGVDGWSGSNNFTRQLTSPVATVGGFKIGDRIQVNANTNVRQSGTLAGALLGTQTIGAFGQIIGGPVTASGITWWQMNYDIGVDGWSGSTNFVAAATASVTRTTQTSETTTQPTEPTGTVTSEPTTLPSSPTGLRILPN